MVSSFRSVFISFILLPVILLAQPDPQFEPFDWILYTQHGSINSISEGYSYAYFATENGGILRYNLYSDQFEEPITIAQGLDDNQITSVYFDRSTGILWAATNRSINYSFDSRGNWNSVTLKELGVKTPIRMIGSSANYIWIDGVNVYVKLDKVSGISLGLYPLPDEYDIDWSSNYEIFQLVPNELQNYSAMEGWIISSAHFINPFGKWINLTSYYYGHNSNVYIGLEDGNIFIGKTTDELIYPYEYGLNQSVINKMSIGENMWLIGQSNERNIGIAIYNSKNDDFYHIDFDNEINFNPGRFSAILDINDEVWVGGYSKIAIYDKKKDYWREIGEEHGIPNATINEMVEDETSVWLATDSGLYKVSKFNKYVFDSDIEKSLKLENINDLKIVGRNLWIATDRNLLVYNDIDNTLSNFKEIGNIDSIRNIIGSFNNFTDISIVKDILYFSTINGVLSFDIVRDKWEIAVEPSLYSASSIFKTAFEGNFCFLGTDSGLWQIDMRGGYSKQFNYNFIGEVTDLLIKEDRLYIGSDNGLIKFLWKKSL